MAKSNSERQAEMRKRRAKLGQKQRVKYLTDEENKKVDAYIKRIRKAH